jgi:HlyD family secretion protein
MKIKRVAIIISIMTIIIGVSILFYLIESSKIESIGIIKPKIIEHIIIDFPAKIEKIFIQNGQRVSSGEQLIQLDIDEFKSQIAGLEFELKQIKSEMQVEGSDIDKLNTELAEKNESLKDEEDSLSLKENAFGKGAVSQSEIDISKNTVRMLNREIKTLTISLEAKLKGNNQLIILNDKHASLTNKIVLLKNKLKKNFLKDNFIICPFISGVISNINCIENDYKFENKTLLDVNDLGSLYVEAKVYSKYLPDIQSDLKANIILLTEPKKIYSGTVTYIARVINPDSTNQNSVSSNEDSNTFDCDIIFKQSDDNIIPYQRVNLEIFKK